MKYKVRFYGNNIYEVVEIHIKYGERISAYESEPDVKQEVPLFQGSFADCYAYLKLREEGYM